MALEEGPALPYEVAPSQVPPFYVAAPGRPSPAYPSAAGEPSTIEQKAPTVLEWESKPAEPGPPPPPRKSRMRLILARPVRITRKTLALSAIAAVVIVIVMLGFLGGPLTLPGLFSTTETQATSQATTTQETGPALDVEIGVTRNPISPGATQVLIVTVHERSGSAVSDASVRVEVVYPSGQNAVSEGLTDTNGRYVYALHITASPESTGTFQVTVSATKAGYQPGEAQTTFLATTTPG